MKKMGFIIILMLFVMLTACTENQFVDSNKTTFSQPTEPITQQPISSAKTELPRNINGFSLEKISRKAFLKKIKEHGMSIQGEGVFEDNGWVPLEHGAYCATENMTFFFSEDEQITRIVAGEGVETDKGIRAGDPIEKVIELYGEDFTEENLAGNDINNGSYYIEYKQADGSYLAFFFSYGKLSVWSIADRTQINLQGEPGAW